MTTNKFVLNQLELELHFFCIISSLQVIKSEFIKLKYKLIITIMSTFYLIKMYFVFDYLAAGGWFKSGAFSLMSSASLMWRLKLDLNHFPIFEIVQPDSMVVFVNQSDDDVLVIISLERFCRASCSHRFLKK